MFYIFSFERLFFKTYRSTYIKTGVNFQLTRNLVRGLRSKLSAIHNDNIGNREPQPFFFTSSIFVTQRCHLWSDKYILFSERHNVYFNFRNIFYNPKYFTSINTMNFFSRDFLLHCIQTEENLTVNSIFIFKLYFLRFVVERVTCFCI